MSLSTEPLLVSTLFGRRSIDRTPVWFMRQAGRYLPEYRQLREQHSLLHMMTNPVLAAEVTLQPLKRFDLDAAIIFADILTPLMTLGVKLDFKDGVGPILELPGGIENIISIPVNQGEEIASFTTEAIRIVSAELATKNIPVIGFCGAPLTLAAYLLEGNSEEKRALRATKELLRNSPKDWHALMDRLSSHLIQYLLEQVNAGAQALQIFDSWVGGMSPLDFQSVVLPYLEKIVNGVKAKSSVPIIYFGLGNTGHLPHLTKLKVDCFSIDWTVDLLTAQSLLGGSRVLQGNLDPTLLLPPYSSAVQTQCRAILTQGRELRGHVFNVGHGFTPSVSIDSVHRTIETIRSFDATR